MLFRVTVKSGAFAKIFIFIGVTLILFNIIGYFYYTEITVNNKYLLDTEPRTISEKEFWNGAYKINNETLEVYLYRLTELVSKRMLRIDSKHTKPKIFENWILWIYAITKGYYEWSDTKRAIKLGGGFCSQHAIVFNNLLRKQGIKSRILGLQGHVVNETLINGQWKVYDPDYNIVFNATLQDLENNPTQAYQTYLASGAPDSTAKNFEQAFATEADNFRYKKTVAYRGEKYYIEITSLYLVWIIPILLILSGLKFQDLRSRTLV
ncbi:hypothetical protein MNBD_GAMMA13-32 [hydrothermal vent metagenome]|uniref:Transglutaminase-like domain-containing protein n=1 Tax=hydrothermal vent metagenome TaxID=652676 RepID=A0A3B0YJ35_9ZZZZ